MGEHRRVIEHHIGGRAYAGTNARTSEVFDPATGQVTAHVVLGDAADVDHAVAVAAEAARTWTRSALSERTAVLFAFREAVARNLGDIAAAITSEHGKVLSDAAGEVQRGLEVIEYACGIASSLKGEVSIGVSSQVDTYSLQQPLGVVVGITPFNFPAMVPLWMFPIAIACGNTFVLKPSERDPSASMLLAELFREAGLPDGVFNVLHGDGATAKALIAHPEVAAVSFVGSTPAARSVHASATEHGKRVQALGGAKNHMVVLPDADLDAAADAAVSAGYGSAGERCMAISVLVTVGDIADDLLARIRTRIAAIEVGPGVSPTAAMGPLITREHRDRVAGYVAQAVTDGAAVTVDGRDAQLPEGDGYWLGPTLVDHVTPQMSVYRDEVFGPLLSVVRTASLDEAIALINANAYGNGTAVFTSSGAAARHFELEINVGMVGVNVAIPVPVAYHSFGGWKDSLFGGHRIYGPDGVRFYTREKVVTRRWSAVDGVDLGFPTA